MMSETLWVSIRSLKFQSDEIITVGALELDGIALPPGEVSAKLEGGKAGEYVMIEESAQPARVMTTDLKGLPDLMTGGALALHTRNGGHNFFSNPRIFRHVGSSPFVNQIRWAMVSTIATNASRRQGLPRLDLHSLTFYPRFQTAQLPSVHSPRFVKKAIRANFLLTDQVEQVYKLIK
jgi:hypothetical protein